MEKVYIVAAQRTPIGKFNGQLASKSAVELGAIAIKAAVEKAKLSGNDIDQVLMGNVIQAGTGQNPARQASMAAGLGEQVPAITINDVCASGMSSVNLAASLIRAGQANVIVAGGWKVCPKPHMFFLKHGMVIGLGMEPYLMQCKVML